MCCRRPAGAMSLPRSWISANYIPTVSYSGSQDGTIFPQMKALIDGTLDVGFAPRAASLSHRIDGLHHRSPGLVACDTDRASAGVAQGHRAPRCSRTEHFVATSLEMDVGFWGNIQAITLPGMSLKVVTRSARRLFGPDLGRRRHGPGRLSESLTNIVVPGVVCRRSSRPPAPRIMSWPIARTKGRRASRPLSRNCAPGRAASSA